MIKMETSSVGFVRDNFLLLTNVNPLIKDFINKNKAL